MASFRLKTLLVAPLRVMLRGGGQLREACVRLYAHAALAADLKCSLPDSVVALGRAHVYGSARIEFGEDTLLYPGLHLETQGAAKIVVGDGVVISRGAHLVAMAGITIGEGSMIGEYASLRDANHSRVNGVALRDAGHTAHPIRLGREVWVGRGAAILAGVSIGDGATIGANAVVTRDVPAGAVVGGVPAVALRRVTEVAVE